MYELIMYAVLVISAVLLFLVKTPRQSVLGTVLMTASSTQLIYAIEPELAGDGLLGFTLLTLVVAAVAATGFTLMLNLNKSE